VGVFSRALLDRLVRTEDLDLVAFSVSWRGRDRLPEVVPDGVTLARRPMAARPLRGLWRWLDRPTIETWTGPVDLVHGPNYVVPPSRRAARLMTVHDLTAIRFPELCTREVLQWPDLVRRAVDRGAWVHAISHSVAGEVIEDLGVPADRVVTIHNGVDEVEAATPGSGRALAGFDRYVLAIGTLEPRKDLPALVRAFDLLAATDRELGLVLAGDDGWGADAVHAAIAAATHRDRIRCTGWVGGSERAGLLRDAAVLAYPSRYEGFGLPPLEAMQVGVPVVATSVGAIPEVLGDAAALVPLGDEDALAEALLRALGDEAHRAELIRRGHERVARYSWDASAEGIIDLYRRMTD
jgi:glycosyltransferase involved in cell wall biosynthesis